MNQLQLIIPSKHERYGNMAKPCILPTVCVCVPYEINNKQHYPTGCCHGEALFPLRYQLYFYTQFLKNEWRGRDQ
jgi:hypothetical protein